MCGITAISLQGKNMLKNSFLQALLKAISSVCYIGYSPFLAGTLASLAGLFGYVAFIRENAAAHMISVAVITLAGFAVSARAEKVFAQKDAREIVIDDLNGMLVGLLGVPYSLTLSILGFFIFRIMDGLKPYPIYKMEKLKGALGVMGDDLVAGLYTNIALQLLAKFFSL